MVIKLSPAAVGVPAERNLTGISRLKEQHWFIDSFRKLLELVISLVFFFIFQVIEYFILLLLFGENNMMGWLEMT